MHCCFLAAQRWRTAGARPLVAASATRRFSLASQSMESEEEEEEEADAEEDLLTDLKNLVRSKPGNLLKALTELVARHSAARSRPAETSYWTVVSRKKQPKPRQVDLRPPEPLPVSGKGMSKGKGKAPAAVVHAGPKGKGKGKQATPVKGAAPHGKGSVMPAPVNASWHLAFKCVHMVTNIAKLENPFCTNECVRIGRGLRFPPWPTSSQSEHCLS